MWPPVVKGQGRGAQSAGAGAECRSDHSRPQLRACQACHCLLQSVAINGPLGQWAGDDDALGIEEEAPTGGQSMRE